MTSGVVSNLAPAAATPEPEPARASSSVALVLAGGALLGSAGLAAAYLPAAATPLAVGGLRLGIGAIALMIAVPWLGGSRRHTIRLGRRPTIWIMALGAAGFQPLFFIAVDRAGVAIATLVAIGGVPVFAGLIAWVALARRPSRRWALATTIAVTGLILRSWGQLSVGDGLGAMLALLAAMFVACYVVAAKTELDRGTPAVELPAAAYTIGTVLLAPLVLTQPLSWTLEPRGAALVLYLGVMTMGIGNLCSVQGMQHLEPGPAATLLLSEPLIATLLGVVILHEALPTSGAIGIALVLVGLALQAQSTRLSRAIATTPL